MFIVFEGTNAKQRKDRAKILCHPVLVFDDPKTDGVLYGYQLQVFTIREGADGRPVLSISKYGRWPYLKRILDMQTTLHKVILDAWDDYVERQSRGQQSGESDVADTETVTVRLRRPAQPRPMEQYDQTPPTTPIDPDESDELESLAARQSGTPRAGGGGSVSSKHRHAR